MRKTKKLAALMLAGAMAASLAACGGQTASTDTTAAESADGEESKEAEQTADGETYKIGVLQLTQHVALDKTNEGFVAALDDAGIKYEIDQQNAAGEQSACQTIAEKLVNDKDDLIFAIATPAAQAVAEQEEGSVLLKNDNNALPLAAGQRCYRSGGFRSGREQRGSGRQRIGYF